MSEIEVNEGSESAAFWKAIGSSDRSQYDSLLKSKLLVIVWLCDDPIQSNGGGGFDQLRSATVCNSNEFSIVGPSLWNDLSSAIRRKILTGCLLLPLTALRLLYFLGAVTLKELLIS